ncbi:ComEA family DNA-binding protein [Flammeovirga kamogawensis]|nr:helix-hairpin-helix domain-containing protein [Flammeovirga kamogawensis]MBB6463393.1 competence ComEA-like helix-hairpin-helix protein [Flammeovirga kamogawensis]TRX68459.1 helix-hairpin-helix domain-containing protein [Flammeovirga kamogawensis]
MRTREFFSLLLLIPIVLLCLYTPQVYKKIQSILNTGQKDNLTYLVLESTPFIKTFDPNFATPQEWKKYGIPFYLGERIVKFRLKGGQFYEKSDLKKINGMTTELFSLVSPYLIINKQYLPKPQKGNYRKSYKPVIKKKKLKLLSFNPNDVQKQELEAMFFPSSIIKSLIGYRKAGGVLKVKRDFLKLYGVDSVFYKSISDSILLPEDLLIKKKIIYSVDINTGTLEDFKKLSGIGEVRANKIISYRNKLGGSFYKKEQLLEIYGIKDVYNDIVSQLVFKDGSIIKIEVNTVSYEKLATHPYISYKQARWIINYRKQHGPYTSIIDLLKIKTINEQDLENIIPYLSFRK